MTFITPVDGQPAVAEHVAQLTEALSGVRAEPIALTSTLSVTGAATFTSAPTVGGSPLLTQTTADTLFLTPSEGNAAYATPANITSAITAHEGLANPHATYTTDTEVATAISTHAGLADPHPTYSTAAEVTSAITAHEGLANPHGVYLTQSEADALYATLSALTTLAARVTALEVDMAGHTHQSGTVQNAGGTAVLVP